MKIHWRRSAIHSLQALDKWRKEQELAPLAPFLKEQIEGYFQKQNYSVFLPGKAVLIKGYPINLRMVLISIRTSDPYKIFFRFTQDNIEIFLIRHPRQKPLI